MPKVTIGSTIVEVPSRTDAERFAGRHGGVITSEKPMLQAPPPPPPDDIPKVRVLQDGQVAIGTHVYDRCTCGKLKQERSKTCMGCASQARSESIRQRKLLAASEMPEIVFKIPQKERL